MTVIIIIVQGNAKMVPSLQYIYNMTKMYYEKKISAVNKCDS